MTGQVETDGRAPTEFAVDTGFTFRLPGEAVDHRQPEPRALPDGFGGEEGVEGPGGHVVTHACAGVGHADAHVGPVRARRIRGRIGHEAVGGRDGERAAVRHGVARIDRKVENGILELMWIAERRP